MLMKGFPRKTFFFLLSAWNKRSGANVNQQGWIQGSDFQVEENHAEIYHTAGI